MQKKKSNLKMFDVIRGNDGGAVRTIMAERMRVNTRADVYELYIGGQLIAYVPKFGNADSHAVGPIREERKHGSNKA